ncbi:DUF4129 domain-containing protein [Microterricola viridarii]|uniref:Protein-glutamine gamma-glutamyltransferase-like C-terminal domain-containing protein n=1 Tax=Microterricola viridarii TaxID=412690 RepID=A0A0Y0NDN6_9MICO|nr:DUF4129 domain-containing protein [Microterricola viridarii]AMB57866.1 hypothetical protein AWU67_02175 [Microterricola viridarii]
MIGPAPSVVVLAIPVEPDAPEAHRLLLEELAKPPYLAAQPNWFDRASQAFFDWLSSLFSGANGAGGGWLPLVATILVVAAVVVALLVWGVPRLNRRTAASVLFGEREHRTAAQMRAAARDAAASADWPLAITEQFRALAADLAERTVVALSPGTTATDFAAAAARALPAEGAALAEAARAFDAVRYLGRPGSEADYRAVQALDERLQQARPLLPEPAVLA